MGDVASFYSRVAPDYAGLGPPYFALAGERLVQLAGVQPGSVVLDLGTGRGAVLLPAAGLVGSSGRVLGIDVAPGMVEHTGRAIGQLQLTNAAIELMDASQLRLEAQQFSHVLSSFSVFFFEDLPRLLGELVRVLRPRGTAGFAFSRGTDPRWTWYEGRLNELGAFEGMPPPVGYPRIRDESALTNLLREAGFADAAELEEVTDCWYASPEAWWTSLWTHGSRLPLERLAPDVIGQFREEAIARVRSELFEARGVAERMRLVYVLAHTAG
ncbi:MAG TPA: class I SAM-dependent methyltransferase [Chloroflexota bacterium]